MPQIWMTYEELAEMLDCTVMDVRERVQLECLDRKISRDGKKRAKLSMAMVGIFLERVKTIDSVADLAVSDLRKVHGLMSNQDDQTKGSSSRWLVTRQAG
jgi:hypothetical protein